MFFQQLPPPPNKILLTETEKIIIIQLQITKGREMNYGLKASSRSRTDFSSLIRIVVRLGYWSCGVLCAVTRAGYVVLVR